MCPSNKHKSAILYRCLQIQHFTFQASSFIVNKLSFFTDKSYKTAENKMNIQYGMDQEHRNKLACQYLETHRSMQLFSPILSSASLCLEIQWVQSKSITYNSWVRVFNDTMAMNPRKQTLILGGAIVVLNSLNVSYHYLHITHFLHTRAHPNFITCTNEITEFAQASF